MALGFIDDAAVSHTVRTLFEEAEAAFQRGAWSDALAGYAGALSAEPQLGQARFRIADCLLNLEAKGRAILVYEAAAWFFLKNGQPLSALVAIKMLQSQHPGDSELLEAFAKVYGRGSPFLPQEGAPPAALLEGLPLSEEPAQRLGDLESAVRVATDLTRVTTPGPPFPAVPLFSSLSGPRFLELLELLKLRRFAAGDAVIREGEPGSSFFIIAQGTLGITRQIQNKAVRLATLKAGSIFGEMALISAAPRSASAVADSDLALLEVNREALEEAAEASDSVAKALRAFTRGRLLANLFSTSALFKDLVGEARISLLSAFKLRRIFAGDIVIEEGEAGAGLFLMLSGQVEVRQAARPDDCLAKLAGGDVFGEIALLHDRPTVATVSVTESGEALFLAREVFAETLKQHPSLKRKLMEMSETRLKAGEEDEVMVVDDSMIMV